MSTQTDSQSPADGQKIDSFPAIMAENLFTKARQRLLIDIEAELSQMFRLESLAICSYVANTMNPAATQFSPMNPTHEKFLYDVLRDCRTRSPNVAIVLNTMGGDAQFPARVIRLVREDLSFSSFHVVIPHFAKSAGTLLALSSDSAVTGPTTQFGPIDPQIPRVSNQGQAWVSARAVRDTYKDLIEEKIPSLPGGAQVGVSSTIDWLLHRQAIDAIQSTRDLINIIHTKYNNNLNVAKIISDLVETPLSHGVDVSPSQLESFGLRIFGLAWDNALWSRISEYYTRALRNLQSEQQQGHTGIILFESRNVSMGLGAQIPVQQR